MTVQNGVFWRQTFPSPNSGTILCGLHCPATAHSMKIWASSPKLCFQKMWLSLRMEERKHVFLSRNLGGEEWGQKALTTNCMSQRKMFCISLCSCEKTERPEPSQKPTEIPAGTAQIQPGWCLDKNPVTENNLIGQVHQKELKRALEVRVNKWKSHTLIQVCWPLPHYFQISRNLTHFQNVKFIW